MATWPRSNAELDRLDRRDPEFIDRFVRTVGAPLQRRFDSEVRGLERMPRGAALVVGNHNGGTLSPDTFVFGASVYQELGPDQVPWGLAHEFALKIPGIGEFLTRLGAVRACHGNANRLFARGHKVMVYPGGDVEALRPFQHRNRIVFDGRRGYVRLAIREGVPIVPVVAAGAHASLVVLADGKRVASAFGLSRLLRLKVWPLAISIPWGLTFGPLPPYWPLRTRILIETLEPIHFERSGSEAARDDRYIARCDAEVRARMQATLTRLARELEDKRERRGLRDRVWPERRSG